MSQTLELESPTCQADLFRDPPPQVARPLGIERGFDVSFVAELALKEKQIQQNVRPVIAIHKWFARRPGTLFRALLLSEFSGGELYQEFFRAHDFPGLSVADPFMGGGTPILEANRVGCDVAGWDINPMAYWIVRQAVQHLDLGSYRRAAAVIQTALQTAVGALYRTTCSLCGDHSADVKYFLWVKTLRCERCDETFDLLPGPVIATNQRHPRYVLVCPCCGELTETLDPDSNPTCRRCSQAIRWPSVRGGKANCPRCTTVNRFPRSECEPPAHRLLAIEYVCSQCQPRHVGRFFKRPDAVDLARFADATARLARTESQFIPNDQIPAGDETDRLLRWGYRQYRQMFNDRQLLGLETLGRLIAAEDDPALRAALATNLSDLLRYQNMLCRYDNTVLKSLDIFSIHGFPVGLVQCESNLLGLRKKDGSLVGSGGWSNIVDKFARAKGYCDHPYEIRYSGRRKTVVHVPGEWIGDRLPVVQGPRHRRVALHCESAELAALAPCSLDAVLTDPPYFANVQYAELMDFCYVWLRRLVPDEPSFQAPSTRNLGELTGNSTLERGLDHFTAGLSEVFSRFSTALKAGGPFAFTYHHNRLDAYVPIAVALLDARLVCTASLPCPAEMGGSIHIHRSDSSIVDTVFVCRSTGVVLRSQLSASAADVARIVTRDVLALQAGSVKVTRGDARCITLGHLTRIAVWRLRASWDPRVGWAEKRERVLREMCSLTSWEQVSDLLEPDLLAQKRTSFELRENASEMVIYDDEVPF